jgi:hypothetical protein
VHSKGKLCRRIREYGIKRRNEIGPHGKNTKTLWEKATRLNPLYELHWCLPNANNK